MSPANSCLSVAAFAFWNTEGPFLHGSSMKQLALSSTPVKQYMNPVNSNLSPELFSDEEEPLELSTSESFSLVQKVCEKMYVTKNDRKLLRRAQESLGGMPPPPSFTIIQMSAEEMLQKISDNKHLLAGSQSDGSGEVSCDRNGEEERGACKDGKAQRESLLITCKEGDFAADNWPSVVQYRYHGLHYNRSKVSEDFEHLCLKYAERYVGAETQSSCTVFGVDVLSPSKRKCKFKRAPKSPGKRLSHLARRRITFSKDSLHSGAASCSFIGARTRQIMVDARKFELLSRKKSPRKKSPRKTPGKSPRKRVRTPGSSSKSRVSSQLQDHIEDSLNSVRSSSSRASATKRALFQSPDKGETTNGLLQLFGSNISSSSESSQSARRRTPRRALFNSPLKVSPTKMSISSLYPATRKMTPKRALFVSPEKSPSKGNEHCERKRKRTEFDDELPNKSARTNSAEAKPITLTRSQSASSSGSFQCQDIVEHRKKKLIWAVAQALRSQNIDMKHPQFKVFASELARLIRHFLPNLFTNGPRPEGSSTESMLRIAQQYVFAVSRGKTANQILKEAASKVRATKPSGYVGLEGCDKNKENVLQDRVNIMGSDRLQSENSRISKGRRGEQIERIRRVINFGDDEGIGGESFR